MSADHHRSRRALRRPRVVPLTAAAVTVSAIGGWYALGGDSLPGSDTAPAAALAWPGLAWTMDLPWPTEGQASAEIEGIGSLGTKGAQTPVPIASLTKVMTAYVILTGHPMPGGASGPGDLRASAGTGEIRVPCSPGTVFAAPSLIGHYVVVHSYLPPQPFIEAVLAFDPYGTWQARFPGIRFPWVPEDAVLRHIDDE
ncbi:DUF7919 family protein [Streptomyces xanthophaeus]